jgi:hypothetical protein
MTLTTHCNIYILRHTVTEETSNLKDLCLIIITITTIIITKVFFRFYTFKDFIHTILLYLIDQAEKKNIDTGLISIPYICLSLTMASTNMVPEPIK